MCISNTQYLVLVMQYIYNAAMDLFKILGDQNRMFKRDRSLNERAVLGKMQTYLKAKETVLVTGIRRCGKSSLLKLLADTHLKGRYFYVNFDDERLSGLRVEDLQSVYESALQVLGSEQPRYALLDEVQEITGWEKWVNRLCEMEGLKIWVTGSNAQLLSGEMASSLTGRYLPLSLRPFSFAEYLSAVRVKLSYKSTPEKVRIKASFDDYLRYGGMPEVFKQQSLLLAQEYYANILQRDIATRLKLRKTNELKALSKFCMLHTACLHSHNSLAKGFGLKSSHTVQKILASLDAAYLTERSLLYTRSLKQQARNPFKLYAVDHAMARSLSTPGAEMDGRLLETVVFNECRNRGLEVFYWKAPSAELDIYIPDQKLAIQVSWTLRQTETRTRELGSLFKAMEYLKLKQGLILTYDDAKQAIRQDGKTVHILPVWQWLLG